MSRTQQLRRGITIGLVCLAAVHLVARIAWVVVPMFHQCTRYIPTTRMLSMNSFELSFRQHVSYNGLSTFESYPYDSLRTLIFSHLYGLLACGVVIMFVLLALNFHSYFGQDRSKRGRAIGLWGMGATTLSLISVLMSVGALHFNSQLQALCGPVF